MDLLRKFFPHAYAVNDLKSAIVMVLVYAVVNAVAGFVLKILGAFPLIGFVFGIFGWLVMMYCFIGIVVTVLKFLNILK